MCRIGSSFTLNWFGFFFWFCSIRYRRRGNAHACVRVHEHKFMIMIMDWMIACWSEPKVSRNRFLDIPNALKSFRSAHAVRNGSLVNNAEGFRIVLLFCLSLRVNGWLVLLEAWKILWFVQELYKISNYETPKYSRTFSFANEFIETHTISNELPIFSKFKTDTTGFYNNAKNVIMFLNNKKDLGSKCFKGRLYKSGYVYNINSSTRSNFCDIKFIQRFPRNVLLNVFDFVFHRGSNDMTP